MNLVDWYRLVLVNRWPIDNHTKTIHQLLSIGSTTSNRCHTHYLSDHPAFLGSPGDKIGETNSDPVFSMQRIYTVACVLKLHTCLSLPFRVARHHRFATIRAAIVGNFIVCQSTTSVTRICLWRHHFPFLTSIDWPMEQSFNLSKKKNWFVNVKEKEDNVVLVLTLKWNVFTITAYKVVFYLSIPKVFLCSQTPQKRLLRRLPSIFNQSIPIYLSIGIDNRYQSITTQVIDYQY